MQLPAASSSKFVNGGIKEKERLTGHEEAEIARHGNNESKRNCAGNDGSRERSAGDDTLMSPCDSNSPLCLRQAQQLVAEYIRSGRWESAGILSSLNDASCCIIELRLNTINLNRYPCIAAILIRG